MVIITRHYGIQFDLLKGIFLFSASIALTALAPFSPGGLGVTEGGLASILYLLNVPLETALAIIFVFRMTTLAYSVLLGLVCLAVFYGGQLKDKFMHAKA
jgi:uncharacterized protein (TIRG00374 family)